MPSLQDWPRKVTLTFKAYQTLADGLCMQPDSGQEWTSAQLNRILGCLVTDRRGNNLHTFQCFHLVEFESDLYRGVMRARCYPFNMAQHRFRGKNVKVRDLRVD